MSEKAEIVVSKCLHQVSELESGEVIPFGIRVNINCRVG
jgi:hypothetical protein